MAHNEGDSGAVTVRGVRILLPALAGPRSTPCGVLKIPMMSGRVTRWLRSRRPDWLTTWLRRRELRRTVREIDNWFKPLADSATGDDQQAILVEWAFNLEWPNSKLAELETRRLGRLARRWNVDSPSPEHDYDNGCWYIPDEPRKKLRRDIREARREIIRWWIQVVVVPLMILVSAATAVISLVLTRQ